MLYWFYSLLEYIIMCYFFCPKKTKKQLSQFNAKVVF
jgi:hypothetical protein